MWLAFGALGAALGWSRLVALDQSMWGDEIYTVIDYIRPGPDAIFLGDYRPKNHMLFSLLTWLTSSMFNGTEIVYRFWSVFPFITGVVVGSAWLQRRHGTLAASLYTFLAIQSPLLLDLSRQARGYGLAFLAMTVLVISACEAYRSRGPRPVAAFCAAGVLGTWTLPVFGLAFGATIIVLYAQPDVRKRLVRGLAVSAVAVLTWYLPVLDQLASSSQQEFGFTLSWHAPLTAPVYQLLMPSLSPGYEKPVIAVAGAFLIFGTLLAAGARVAFERSRPTAAVLVAGVVGTYLVLTLARFFLVERFVSYLLVPLLILVALGLSEFARTTRENPTRSRLLFGGAWAVVLIFLGSVFVRSGLDAVRYPIEANQEVAALIHDLPPTSKVVANLWDPDPLRFYVQRPVLRPSAARLREIVCTRGKRDLVYVESNYRTPKVDLGCLRRAGATRRHFIQRGGRGEWVDVWFLPGTA